MFKKELLTELKRVIKLNQYPSEFGDMAIEVKYIKMFIEENS